MKPAAWLYMLCDDDYLDPDSHYILDGIYHGFRMVDPGAAIVGYQEHNYNSAIDNHDAISLLLRQELTAGKLSFPKDPPVCVHAIGAITKAAGKIRPITDCSRPKYEAVNNYMDDVFSTFCYKTIDDVLFSMHYGSYMCTVDRSMAIHLDDKVLWLKLGFSGW